MPFHSDRSLKVLMLWLGLLFFLLVPSSLLGQEKTTIGVVFSADIPFYSEIHSAFIKRLRKGGYLDRVNILIQKPNPDAIAWSNAIRKLLAYDASIIVAYGSGAADAARYEVHSTPLLFAGVYEPIKAGLKTGNFSGVGYRVPVSSLIRYLKKVVPVKRIGIVYSKIEKSSFIEAKEVEKTCKTFSTESVLLRIRNSSEIREKLRLYSIDSLFITGSAVLAKNMSSFSNLLEKKGISVVTTMGGLEQEALISLYTKPSGQGIVLADKLIRLLREGDLRGKAGQITILMKNRLVFNLKLARKLGLDVPVELLTESDRLIR